MADYADALRALPGLSDADLWDTLRANEVPWFNGASELHRRLEQVTRERDALAARLERTTEANGRNLSARQDAEQTLEWVREALARENS